MEPRMDVSLYCDNPETSGFLLYYEREIDLDAVKRIYRHEPLSLQLVEVLNPELTLEELAADIEQNWISHVKGDARLF